MAKKRMGFEGILLMGAAGATAATELTIARDVKYSFDPNLADVSDRASIYNLSDVAGIGFSLEFEVNNKDADANVAALRAAAIAGDAVALLTADYAGGWGVDGDFVLKEEDDQALRDAQRLKFTATPTDKAGRLPTWGTQSSTTTAAP